MPHKFDAASKHIVEAYPGDWIALGGMPPGGKMEVINPDLSAVSTAADKLIRVSCASPYVGHVEFQSGPDSTLDERVLVYNVLARQRTLLPVFSVAFLLRPQALVPGVQGRVTQNLISGHRLEFEYKLVRVWELSADALLSGGLGTLPLAPISAVSEAELPQVIETMRRRLDAEAPTEEAREIWVATNILMGLRYSRQMVHALLKGVRTMEESTTYQEIVEKGVERGMLRGEKKGWAGATRLAVTKLGTKQFGPPDQGIRERLESIDDFQRLEQMMERLLNSNVKSWTNLLDTAE